MKTYRFHLKTFLTLGLTILLASTGMICSAEEQAVPTATPAVLETPTPGTDPTATPGTVPEQNPTATPGTVPEQNPTATPGTVPEQNPTATPGTTPEPNPTSAPTPDVPPTPEPTATPSPTPDPRIQCGQNAWALLSEDGVLTVDGTGDMWDYSKSGDSVFESIRTRINKIVIKDGITKVGAYSFENSSCGEITFGNGVRCIGRRAFCGLYNLKSVMLPPNIKWTGPGAFRECRSLMFVGLPEGLETIGKYTFYEDPLSSMSSLTFPESVIRIYKRAFAKTNVSRVTIPSGVKEIQTEAFGRVSALIYSDTVQIAAKAFASGSTITARSNSTADAYAQKEGLKILHLNCEPAGGLPATTHQWGEWTVTKTATCSAAGERTHTCTVCGKTEAESIKQSDHTYGAWSTLSAPTVLSKGMQYRICTVCGYRQTAELEKLKAVLRLNTDGIMLNVGETYRIKALQKSAGDSIATCTSSDKTVAKVGAKGKVTAKGAGTAVVTVKMESGLSASVNVVVKRIPTTKLTVSAKGASLASKKVSVKVNKKFTLVPKVKPANSSDKVTYTSSKKSIVTVTSKGLVTARKKGKAKITVKSGNRKVVITVTVK